MEALGDGGAALEKVTGADVLVTDIGVPGIDGLELLSRAKARDPRVAVIVMTGYDSPHSRSEAQRRGRYAYLVKPFGGVELLGRLRTLEAAGGVRRAEPPGIHENGPERGEEAATADEPDYVMSIGRTP